MTGFDPKDLARTTRGLVVEAGDDLYDEARAVWKARFDRRRAVIVRCCNATDVQAAVDFARSHHLPLSIKGGGHAFAANTVGEGGLSIDLSPMKGVLVNAEMRTVRVEPGVKWCELDHSTQEFTSWTLQLHEALTPFSTGGVYVNALGTGEEDRVRAAYGSNYDRLADAKRKWDPHNLFRTNHNIRIGSRS